MEKNSGEREISELPTSEGRISSELCRVAVRLPPFWPEEPALWFAQCEGNFVLSNITSDVTKFYYVAAQLDHTYAVEVKDIIKNPPETGKYEKLKTELIKRLSASQEKKVKRLLMHEDLGDRKPSQFLRRLQDLAGPSIPNDFLQTIWSSRLPQNVQTIVASQNDLPLEKLADLADKVHEIAPATPQVASTSTEASSSEYQLMAKQISELTRQVASLTSRLEGNSRSRSRSRSNYKGRRGNSRPRDPPADHPHCWYHYTHGSKAKKCVQPCTYSSENSQGSRK
ncbi:uncharacterized protein LOC114357293 [Ostrinia furnacalis]|uniref:uncharacterized protein LOC114357293 n=1 Tax=Ostrinia furnacalis TaxID=93504 RepID=UPI0010408A57|nr:uncharacterized protein LOC114357293 [Ostrinia furnacalis]